MDDYWLKRIERRNCETQVVIDGTMYQIGREDESGFRGFGGRPFAIEFFDKRKVVTTNLWCNGKIPDEYRNQLPDNAKWGTYKMITDFLDNKKEKGIITYENLLS